MAQGTAVTRRAEARLTTAAPKVALALSELRDGLDAPFGALSTGSMMRSDVRYARDELFTACAALKNALEALHEVNTEGDTR